MYFTCAIGYSKCLWTRTTYFSLHVIYIYKLVLSNWLITIIRIQNKSLCTYIIYVDVLCIFICLYKYTHLYINLIIPKSQKLSFLGHPKCLLKSTQHPVYIINIWVQSMYIYIYIYTHIFIYTEDRIKYYVCVYEFGTNFLLGMSVCNNSIKIKYLFSYFFNCKNIQNVFLLECGLGLVDTICKMFYLKWIYILYSVCVSVLMCVCACACACVCACVGKKGRPWLWCK